MGWQWGQGPWMRFPYIQVSDVLCYKPTPIMYTLIMIKNIRKKGRVRHLPDSYLRLQLMKATVLAESSFIFSLESVCYEDVYRHQTVKRSPGTLKTHKQWEAWDKWDIFASQNPLSINPSVPSSVLHMDSRISYAANVCALQALLAFQGSTVNFNKDIPFWLTQVYGRFL